MKKIEFPKEYKEVKHPITGETVRIHGTGAYRWGYVGRRGTGYKGLGRQIPLVGMTKTGVFFRM